MTILNFVTFKNLKSLVPILYLYQQVYKYNIYIYIHLFNCLFRDKLEIVITNLSKNITRKKSNWGINKLKQSNTYIIDEDEHECTSDCNNNPDIIIIIILLYCYGPTGRYVCTSLRKLPTSNSLKTLGIELYWIPFLWLFLLHNRFLIIIHWLTSCTSLAVDH